MVVLRGRKGQSEDISRGQNLLPQFSGQLKASWWCYCTHFLRHAVLLYLSPFSFPFCFSLTLSSSLFPNVPSSVTHTRSITGAAVPRERACLVAGASLLMRDMAVSPWQPTSLAAGEALTLALKGVWVVHYDRRPVASPTRHQAAQSPRGRQ